MAKKPLVEFTRNAHWTNHHQTFKVTVERLYDPLNLWADHTRPATNSLFKAGLSGLKQIVRDAEAAGRRVRALGGGWSLSRVAATGDFLVNTKLLNYINIGFKAANVDAKYRGNRKHLVFAQCGASVMELNQALEPRGLSLPTSGASNGQTLCGAIGTGTHGSNRTVGAMHDFILGLHVVAADGKTFWIERKSKPVVTQAFCKAIGATLKRENDHLFNAAVVGLGSFGLVHAVAFEAVPIFTLEKYGKLVDYSAVLPVVGTLDVTQLNLVRGPIVPDHFEVIVNPYATGNGKRGAYLRYMYQFAVTPDPRAMSGGVFGGAGDDVLGLLGRVTNHNPNLVAPLADFAFGQLKEGGPAFRSLGDTFGATTTGGFVMSTEIGIAATDAAKALQAVVDVSQRFPWAGLVALRYVKSSKAFMAFTHHAPVTCTIELPGAGSPRTADAYEQIWDEFEARGIPYSLHWGQMLRYDPTRVKAAFGKRVNQWLKARRDFLDPDARRTFSNSLIESAGLAG